jgi:hypothetical protein
MGHVHWHESDALKVCPFVVYVAVAGLYVHALHVACLAIISLALGSRTDRLFGMHASRYVPTEHAENAVLHASH